MKKILLLLTAFMLSASLFAQEKMKGKMKSGGHKMEMKEKMQDCIMMEDGKMMVMKDGQMTAMDKDMTMKNGAMVMTDGTVKMKNGKTMKLKNNQCVYMSGKMGSMKMKEHKM